MNLLTTLKGLRSQRDSSVVVEINFLKSIQRKPNDEFLWVFEGQDIKYYAPRIERFFGKAAGYIFIADGRSNVLKCLNRFSSDTNINTERVAFFVDRDIVSPPQSPFLYITPTYSIENFYVTSRAFESVLISLFGLAVASRNAERQSIIKLYNKWCSQFSKKMTNLMLWIYVQHIHLETSSNQLNLKNVSISKLIEIKISGRKLSLNCDFGVRNAKTLFPKATIVSNQMLTDMKNTLTEVDWVKLGRGKYWAEFYTKVILFLIEDSNSKSPKVLSTQHKVHIHLSMSNFLETFTSQADTPECLQTFLESRSN